MIARLRAWRLRRSAELVKRQLAEPFPPPPIPGVTQAEAEQGMAQLGAMLRQSTTQAFTPFPPPARPPSAYVRHLWPPFPPPLPPRETWQLRPAPACDPAWRAATARRPGYATYPPTRPARTLLDDPAGDVP